MNKQTSDNSYPMLSGMELYVGFEACTAKPMDRVSYNELRGFELPKDENGIDQGYVIQDVEGYLTWLPTRKFKQRYRKSGQMTFGMALQIMKNGFNVSRSGWNGNGMFLFLVPGSTFEVNRPPLLGIYEPGKKIDYQAHIDMRTADGTIVPWSASQTDMLSEDWMIVD